jgi:hypothetical protein
MWGLERGEEDIAQLNWFYCIRASRRSIRSSDDLTEHKIGDIVFGEERLYLRPLIQFVEIVETI